MSVNSWARNELELLEKGCTDEEGLKWQKEVTEGIMDIMDLISKQGHSGFSIGYYKNLLCKLLDNKPLTQLTGEDDEWEDVSHYADMPKGAQLQNKRCSAVFKEGNRIYYLNGKAFSDDGGQSWYTNGNSFIDIVFPCDIPETEYIILDKK